MRRHPHPWPGAVPPKARGGGRRPARRRAGPQRRLTCPSSRACCWSRGACSWRWSASRPWTKPPGAPQPKSACSHLHGTTHPIPRCDANFPSFAPTRLHPMNQSSTRPCAPGEPVCRRKETNMGLEQVATERPECRWQGKRQHRRDGPGGRGRPRRPGGAAQARAGPQAAGRGRTAKHGQARARRPGGKGTGADVGDREAQTDKEAHTPEGDRGTQQGPRGGGGSEEPRRASRRRCKASRQRMREGARTGARQCGQGIHCAAGGGPPLRARGLQPPVGGLHAPLPRGRKIGGPVKCLSSASIRRLVEAPSDGLPAETPTTF